MAEKAVTYRWLKNGDFLDVSSVPNIFRESSVKNGNILIFANGVEDEGTYQCVAENSAGKTYAQSTLVTERRLKSPKAIADTRRPVFEKVRENLPNFVTDNSRGRGKQPLVPVYVVYPQMDEKDMVVEVIDMLTEETEGNKKTPPPAIIRPVEPFLF